MRIVFTKASGFVAWAIRTITGSEASHVAVELDDGTFLQADQGGIAIADRNTFLENGDRTIIASFEPTAETLPLIDIAWGKSKIGSDYDYVGLVGDLVPMLSWRWFHIKLGDPLGSARKFWCSEYVAEMDTQKKIPEFQVINPRVVSPGELLDAMNKGKSFIKTTDA
jgi:hypothetical protein